MKAYERSRLTTIIQINKVPNDRASIARYNLKLITTLLITKIMQRYE